MHRGKTCPLKIRERGRTFGSGWAKGGKKGGVGGLGWSAREGQWKGCKQAGCSRRTGGMTDRGHFAPQGSLAPITIPPSPASAKPPRSAKLTSPPACRVANQQRQRDTQPSPSQNQQQPVKVITQIKEVPVDRIVVKEVPVPVDRIVEKTVVKEVPVDRIVEKTVVKEVPVEVVKEVPVEVVKQVEVPVEVVKEVPVEVVKEVPIEVIKEVSEAWALGGMEGGITIFWGVLSIYHMRHRWRPRS